MIRSLDELQRLGVRKVLNRVYYEMIALSLMYKDYDYSEYAVNYARRTIMHSGYNTFKINGTGLFKCFVFINNIAEFDLSEKDVVLLRRTSLDVNNYTKLLRRMATGALPISELNRFIKLISKRLYIEDNLLMAFGRLSVNWHRLSIREKHVTLKKLRRYGVINARRAEITEHIVSFSDQMSIDYDEDKQERLRQVRKKRSRPDQKVGVDPESDDTIYATGKDSQEPRRRKRDKKSPSWGQLGLAALGGYALSQFLSSKKKDKNQLSKDDIEKLRKL